MSKTNDGSYIDNDGKIIFFSIEKFVKDIVKGENCFICGASKKRKKFNDEHIISNWILKNNKLHSYKITLPNNNRVKYGSYKVPCCCECNIELGEHFEIPLSEAIKLGYDNFINFVNNNKENELKLFQWMSLLFFKAHYKDREYNLFLDKRKRSEKISSIYEWEEFHHIL